MLVRKDLSLVLFLSYFSSSSILGRLGAAIITSNTAAGAASIAANASACDGTVVVFADVWGVIALICVVN
jgi:hypothetical protein